METRTYTERSNARRAAKAAGVDPDLVFSTDDGFTFPPPRPDQGNDIDTEASAEQRKAEAAEDDPLDIPECLKRPAPTPEQQAALAAKAKRESGPEREIVMPKSKPASSKSAKPKKASGTDKNTTLLKMLEKGATVDALCKATDWLPHTLRARLSRLHKPKSKGGDGLKIARERVDGVTSYRIAS